MDAKIPALILGLVGGLCVIVGLWLVLARNSGNDAAVAGERPEPTTNSAAAPTAVSEVEPVPSTAPDTESGGGPVTVTVPFPDGQSPPSTISTLPPEAVDFTAPCDPNTGGYGIERKLWGSPESGVWLPYANGWPANTPGEPPVCAPETDFGAAVVAAHVIYVEDFSPEWIPAMAQDTPGRQLRLDGHDGGGDLLTYGHVCEPVGWAAPDDGLTWIFHRCDNGPLWVAKVHMVWRDGRWQLRYLTNGQVAPHELATAGMTYAPFGEGAG